MHADVGRIKLSDPFVQTRGRSFFLATSGHDCKYEADLSPGSLTHDCKSGAHDVFLILQKHMNHAGLASRCMLLLANLSENDDVKKTLCQGDSLPLMLTAMQVRFHPPAWAFCSSSNLSHPPCRISRQIDDAPQTHVHITANL